MFKRVIYTLYMFSKERKIGDDFLMSGGSAFFLIFINLIAMGTVVFWLMKESFGAFFVKHEYVFLPVILVGFFLAQLYAKYLIKSIEKEKIEVKQLRLVSILVYSIVSVILLLLSMSLL